MVLFTSTLSRRTYINEILEYFLRCVYLVEIIIVVFERLPRATQMARTEGHPANDVDRATGDIRSNVQHNKEAGGTRGVQR